MLAPPPSPAKPPPKTAYRTLFYPSFPTLLPFRWADLETVDAEAEERRPLVPHLQGSFLALNQTVLTHQSLVTRRRGLLSIEEQLLGRNVKRFRGGLVFKAHRILYHSTLGSTVIKKKKKSHTCAQRESS